MPLKTDVELSVSPRASTRARCAWCHDRLESEEWDACPGCRTVLHLECAETAGRCPALGCAFGSRVRIRVLRRGTTRWEFWRRVIGGVILPVAAIAGNEAGLAEPVFSLTDRALWGAVYHPEAQRFLYPAFAVCIAAFIGALRGQRSDMIRWGLIGGSGLALAFTVFYLPLLPFSVAGLLVGVGVLGFAPFFALGSFHYALERYDREPSPRVELGPWEEQRD